VTPSRRSRVSVRLQVMLALGLAVSLGACEEKATVSPILTVIEDPTAWYVATTGDDQANSCHSASSPCLTVQSVIDRAADGDVVHVADGVYSGHVDIHELGITLVGSGPNTILENPYTEGEGEMEWGGGVMSIDCGICASPVTISNLTMRNGTAANGGALYVQKAATALENVVIRDSTASNAGCLFVYAETTVTLHSVVLDSCTAGTDGGAIYNNGVVNISGSALRNNVAGDRGGGLFNALDTTATISSTMIEYNTAQERFGGGVFNMGSLTITTSTLRGNTAAALGGTGGGVHNSGHADIIATTLSANGASHGAGILNSGYLYSYNTTISGNNGNGISAIGTDQTTRATSLTIAQNSDEGIANRDGGTFYVTNTLLADNGSALVNIGGKMNCNSQFPFSGTGNLSSDNTCNFTGGALAGVDPVLGPLEDNGGPTQTHELLPGSPAIDTGVNLSYQGTGIDQRGVSRPIDGDDDGVPRNDIGAFEADPKLSAALAQDFLLQTPLPPPTLFTPQQPSNCRQGPGTVYPATASIPAGVAFLVDGQNEAGDWYRLWLSDQVSCWVKGSLGVLEGEPDGLFVLAAPPTPRPTIAPQVDDGPNCSAYNGLPDKCSAHTECEWDNPICRNRE